MSAIKLAATSQGFGRVPQMQGFPAATTLTAPRVLVADDDATSRYFLGDALRQLGADVSLCEDGNSALGRARTESFELLLLDYHMPDVGAVGILGQLRNEAAARSTAAPAVVSSAELDISAQNALVAAGFHAVLLKPCTLQNLREVLLLAPGFDRLPWLDDSQARVTSGSAQVVNALRALFYQELVSLDGDLDVLSRNNASLNARLHKLRSSCGFCGATALGEHIANLQTHLKLEHQGAMLPLTAFRHSLQQTMQALRASA